MNFRSNKTLPQPVRQIVDVTQPLDTKAKFDPVFLDLSGKVKEKKLISLIKWRYQIRTYLENQSNSTGTNLTHTKPKPDSCSQQFTFWFYRISSRCTLVNLLIVPSQMSLNPLRKICSRRMTLMMTWQFYSRWSAFLTTLSQGHGRRDSQQSHFRISLAISG